MDSLSYSEDCPLTKLWLLIFGKYIQHNYWKLRVKKSHIKRVKDILTSELSDEEWRFSGSTFIIHPDFDENDFALRPTAELSNELFFIRKNYSRLPDIKNPFLSKSPTLLNEIRKYYYNDIVDLWFNLP